MQAPNPGAMVIVAKGIGEQGRSSFVTLPHPKSGTPTSYVLQPRGLQEIHRFKPMFASWFVGDTVLQDGSLYICSPVDALLVLLPLLERGRGQQGAASLFKDAEELLSLADWPHARLLEPLALSQLAAVCDAKQVGGQAYYRLNDDKVVAWLRCKVDQAQQGLLAMPNSPYHSMDVPALAAYAAGLVCEYLSDGWVERLSTSLGLVPEAERAGPSPEAFWMEEQVGQPEKRAKIDPKTAAKAKAAESRQQSKAAKMAKEASGMRKLSAFFTTKPAKS